MRVVGSTVAVFEPRFSVARIPETDITDTLTTAVVEQESRLHILSTLLPHFGKSIDKPIDAATLVEEYLKGMPLARPGGTGSTE